MKEHSEILTEHYQKTYDLTFDLWKERNRIFLALITVIGGATILTFNPATANPLLVLWAAKALGVTDKNQIQDFSKSFPFGLVQTILFIVIFYLMVNLYHRALYILRNYRYLAELEKEIRAELGSTPQSVAFTREGSFYWTDRRPLQGAVKWCFIVLVGSLLLAFMGGRIYTDFKIGNLILALVDVLVSSATALFFVAYARSSVSLDRAKAVLPGEPKVSAKSRGAA
jgi:hypothetical protein